MFGKGKEIVHSFYKYLWRMQKWKRTIVAAQMNAGVVQGRKLAFEPGLKPTPALVCVCFQFHLIALTFGLITLYYNYPVTCLSPSSKLKSSKGQTLNLVYH